MEKIKLLLRLIFVELLLLLFLRILFYFLYFKNNDLNFAQHMQVLYWSLRVDLATVLIINLPLYVFCFLSNILGQKYFKLVFYLLFFPDILLLMLNVIDLAYYKFILRRASVDLVYVLFDSLKPAMSYFISYFYYVVLFVLLCIILFHYVKRVVNKICINSVVKAKDYLYYILFLLFSVLLIRGWQQRPLMPSTPLLYFAPQYQHLINNSGFTFIYSLYRPYSELPNIKNVTKVTENNLYAIKKQYASNLPFNNLNIVFFILESFSKELLYPSDKKAYTPFLDSMMNESIVFDNAFANSIESNKGIVALLGSLPTYTQEPYYYSAFSNNRLRCLPMILREQGYSTSFYMSANPDHFGFGKWSKMIGIDNYYSGNDYTGSSSHFDGEWGIYDHYYFPYVANELKKKAKPFLSVLFNVSSHYPYKIPDEVKSRIELKHQNKKQNSITYVDYAMRLFFDQIKNEPWFRNTIFIFSADHASIEGALKQTDIFKMYQIPIFIFSQGKIKNEHISKTFFQTDVVPTVLHLLNYQQPFMSFGNSVFGNTGGWSVNKYQNLYQYFDSSFVTAYNTETDSIVYSYQYKTDSLLQKNLIDIVSFYPLIQKQKDSIKSFLLRYSLSCKNDLLYVK